MTPETFAAGWSAVWSKAGPMLGACSAVAVVLILLFVPVYLLFGIQGYLKKVRGWWR